MRHMKRSSDARNSSRRRWKPSHLSGSESKRGDAHVERVLAERDADLRGLGGRLTVLRVDLDEVPGGERPLPDGFVEASVERDAFAVGQAHGLDQAARDSADQVLPLENQLLAPGRRPPESAKRERTEQCRDSDSGNQ